MRDRFRSRNARIEKELSANVTLRSVTFHHRVYFTANIAAFASAIVGTSMAMSGNISGVLLAAGLWILTAGFLYIAVQHRRAMYISIFRECKELRSPDVAIIANAEAVIRDAQSRETYFRDTQ